jgi:putative hydrolase of the HAD superfamily
MPDTRDSSESTPAGAAPASVGIRWDRVDAVLLDMDGTILDLAFDIYFWRQAVPARYAQRHGLDIAAARQWLEPHFAALEGTLAWYCLDRWSALTALDLAALKHEVRHRIRPLPGSVAFLRAARASGRPLWLVTNAHRDSWQLKLEHTGLAHHFDRVVCSHDFGAPKEDAAFWAAFVATHPFDPARVMFADDNLPVLRAARAFGIGQLVAISRPESDGARRKIDDFMAVEALADLLPIPPLRSCATDCPCISSQLQTPDDAKNALAQQGQEVDE